MSIIVSYFIGFFSAALFSGSVASLFCLHRSVVRSISDNLSDSD